MVKNDNNQAPLQASVIENEINSRVAVAANVTVLDTIDSTNSWILKNVANHQSAKHRADLLVCAAEEQTSGRGRRGKIWHTPDRGVTFSLCFSLPVALADVGGVSLLAGAAVCECLWQYEVKRALVKWPNDILVDQAKLSGILVEVANHTEAMTTLIVGIGVNYRRGVEQKNIDQASVDLFDLCNGNPPDRSALIGHLAAEVYRYCVAAPVARSLARLSREWSRFDALAGADIQLDSATTEPTFGRADGIDEQGRLRMQGSEGLALISSGDVSVRRSY